VIKRYFVQKNLPSENPIPSQHCWRSNKNLKIQKLKDRPIPYFPQSIGNGLSTKWMHYFAIGGFSTIKMKSNLVEFQLLIDGKRVTGLADTLIILLTMYQKTWNWYVYLLDWTCNSILKTLEVVAWDFNIVDPKKSIL